ncbi:hemerythrin domain-containing protein [Lysobacter olei]
MPETIYDALHESHERQRSLCRKLLRSKPHTAARQAIFTDLRIELAAHAAAEERFLYAPILMDDLGLSPSRHALHEHHEIDEIVEEMRSNDISGRGWMARAKALSHEVHHHLREEEKKFFQLSGKVLSQAQKLKLAKSYRRDYARMLAVLRGE